MTNLDRLAEIWAELDPVDDWRPHIRDAIEEITRLRADLAVSMNTAHRAQKMAAQLLNERALAAPSVPSGEPDIAAKLRDPVAVHAAMLRGEIATPAIRDMLHVYGADALARWDAAPSVPSGEPQGVGTADFEAWWSDHGQFCRAGGGDYEKTFAYRAWNAARDLDRQDWSRVHHALAKHGKHPGRTDDHLADVIDRAIATPQPAPAGWRLVPSEATEAMCKAAVIFANGSAVYKNVATESLKIEESIYGEAYAAMLDAAPAAPGGAQ
jgi:hypothetical protein